MNNETINLQELELAENLTSKEAIEEYIIQVLKDGSVDEILNALEHVSQTIQSNDELFEQY